LTLSHSEFRAERERALNLDHLNEACEVLRCAIVKYEVSTGRHLQPQPPEPIERNTGIKA
jgi:hypothetical protein